ncbi:MAG: type II secretion system minor pseudopilin GspH [Pseudomonadota bacterium]
MARQAAFTLIEILVVMFIVSVMTGLAITNLPGFVRSGDLDLESARLATLLEMAREEALQGAEEYGFRAEPTGYAFLLFDDLTGEWQELQTRPFQPRQLSEGIRIRLRVEDNNLSLLALDENSDDGAERDPPVLLLSSGETTPFELTLTEASGETERTLVADGFNRLHWRDHAQE